MTNIFEKSDEWGGFEIRMGSSGFIIEYHTHLEGEVDGLTIVVPYGTWGFSAATVLDDAYNDSGKNGEILAEMALRDMRTPADERSVHILDEGVVLDRAGRHRREIERVRSGAPAEKREERRSKGGSTWYTLSLAKQDEDGFGRCHDLFTTTFLTHGMPHGLALWTTSDFDTDENIFYAEVPEGMDITGEDFFREFVPAECSPPSMIGLSMLVGHEREPVEPKPRAGLSRRWVHRGAARPEAAP